MGRALAVFGADLIDPDKEDEVILLLLRLPLQPEDKKQLLIEWCQLVGAALDEDMVRRAGAEPAAPGRR